jgi:hypothetical protein
MSSMMRYLLAVVALVGTCGIAVAESTTSPASTQPTQVRFIRFVGDANGGSLETSDIRYRNAAGATVRLVSAVHIADEAYFADLNESFKGCDAVLYEMVKPHDAGAPEPGESHSDISKLQRFLKDTLDLSFQLDEIDYNAKNFVHADLDAETFTKMQAERGESFASLMLSQLIKSLTNPQAQTSPDDVTDSLDLMTRPDGTRQFKLILARQMGSIERGAMGLDAMNGSVLLTERNKAAIRVLRDSLKQGKKNIAIFYGAAHMEDLADRLDLLGFEPVSTKWHAAWDVHIREDKPSAFQLLMEHAKSAATQASDLFGGGGEK